MGIAFNLCAQPPVAFLHHYGADAHERFIDIYAVSDGGLIMCGATGNTPSVSQLTPGDIFVVRTDPEGNVIWRRVYNRDEQATAQSIIETDDGHFIICGSNQGYQHAMRINGEGEELWSGDYVGGRFNAVIELKDGRLLFGGRENAGFPYHAGLVCTNGEGEELWHNRYEREEIGEIYTLREAEGGIVGAGFRATREPRNNALQRFAWMIKVSLDGQQILWEHFHNDIPPFSFYSMTSARDGGFAMVGRNSGQDPGPTLIKVNSNGERLWRIIYREPYNRDVYEAIARSRDGGFLLAGIGRVNDANFPAALRINRDGAVRWRGIYNLAEDVRFGEGMTSFASVVATRQDEFVVCGAVPLRQNGNYDGFIMKLEPDILGPSFIAWSPEDTLLQVLRGTEVTIIAVAHSDYFDNLDYIWS
ncbi:MAG: hypothetical protein FJY67_10265, partial [Calditrichaeota bacterium]|nr:hypothetical protein [Calditrichota bacterium]